MDPVTLSMLVALFAIMYFMLIRPAQKKAKEQQQLVSTIQPGARVMTGSGIYGTVRHVGDLQAIIEISPGIEMTVAKQAILRTVRAEDDEFEYDDDAETADDLDTDETPDELDNVETPDPDAAGGVDAAPGHEVAAEDAPAADADSKR